MNSGFTKEEVLGLHLLSEDEQYDWLNKHGVLKIGLNHCTLGVCEHDRAETLPELAFRLLDEVDVDMFDTYFYVVCKETKNKKHVFAFDEMWEYEAKPIHWIQAALLARLENEK